MSVSVTGLRFTVIAEFDKARPRHKQWTAWLLHDEGAARGVGATKTEAVRELQTDVFRVLVGGLRFSARSERAKAGGGS